MPTGSRTVWTRQDAAVRHALDTDGLYIVREEYVRAKNDSISDYYLELYRWYTAGCRRYMDIPKEATLPIWLALTESARLPAAPGTVSLTLDIPEDQLFIVDYDKWGYRVNNWYVPNDPEDERRHDEELKNYGIVNEAMLTMDGRGNFYPMLRQQIIRSWDRIFTTPSADDEHNVGTCWIIRREWVKEVEIYD